MSLSPARLHALHSIDQRDLPGWPAQSLPRLRPIDLRDDRDVDLSGRIVAGVVKRMLALRHELAALSGRQIERIDVAAQKIAAVALEQLRSLDRVPTHAIVDDAVEQTKRVGPRGAAGFMNAILRKAAARRGQPLPDVGGPAAVQAEHVHSIPRDVFARLAKLYGEADALAMCAGFNREPPTLARLIGDATIDALGTPALPHASGGVVVLTDARREKLAALADANLAQVQDATSVATVDALDLRPGQRVLDRCSGRGTKTRQILERVGPTGRVVAMDTSLDRLASLRATLKPAIQAGTLGVVAAGEVAMLGEQKPFDRVLIDAPCSNSGVLARRPEARYRQSPRDLREVAALQATILADTADVVAPGGLIVYATCSIWPEENEAAVERFLARDGRFRLVGQKSVSPSPASDPTRYHDGGFAATMRRE